MAPFPPPSHAAPILRRLAEAHGTTIRFFVTGGGAALLLFGLTFVVTRAGLPPFAGTLGAYAICLAVAYTAQRAWTFRGMHQHRDALPRYLTAQLACSLASAALAHLLARGGVPALPLSGAVTAVSSALSFALSRWWVFPRAPAPCS